MAKKRPQTVNTILTDPNGDVQFLMHRLSTINALKEQLPKLLSANITKHCRVINLRSSTLVIAVNSSVWANKLRFMLPDLLSDFRTAGYSGLSKIEVVVQPE
ncbi:MAG: hypothetical protein COB38_02525 [Gammaproteobacteria bacterium]|nr:MAG: hypothetical protein COB38_02525 [Gammaproteobacteria bacterium]